ncbi:MAG: methyltransferase [Anaerolineae bacterium]|nr:methyltransferase [Anaerolineae bacterium]
MKFKKFFWRQWLKLRFYLTQRHRHNRLVLETVAGRPFLILPEVFNPTLFLTSEFMVSAFNEHLIPPGSRVLDMGTGSGVGAVFAAQWAAQVIAVDINPAAVRCATINVLLNNLDGCVNVRQSDLFTAVAGQQFDVVLFNPPYFRGQPQPGFDQAWRSEDVLERFAAELDTHLAPNGHALLVLSTAAGETTCLQNLTAAGFEITVVARRDMGSEVVTVYKAMARWQGCVMRDT